MDSNKHTVRLFFALLPDRDTVAALDYHANQFSPGTAKKVRPENYHITLLFLGNVGRQHIEVLCTECDGIDLPAFELEISTPGWWKKAGILWLAPDSVPAPLASLHAALRAIAGRRRIAVENRPYLPHVTLMRKVSAAPQYPVIKPFTWRADSFSLVQSVTRPEGVKYSEIATWPLAP